MFELLKEEEFSLTSYLVQQTVVPIVGFLTVFVPPVFLPFGMPNPTLGNLWATLVALIVPFCLALIARRIGPRLSRDGRLIWLGPMSLSLVCLISDFARSGFRDSLVLTFNPRTGEEGWIFVLLSIPTYACLGYSFGVSVTLSMLTTRLNLIPPVEPRP